MEVVVAVFSDSVDSLLLRKKKRVAVGVVGVDGVAFLLLRPLNPARMAMTMAREIIVVRGAALVALGN